MSYDDFFKIYSELPKKFQMTLDMFIYHLEHDFKRSDGHVFEEIQKHKGDMTWDEFAKMIHAEPDTLKHSKRNKTIRDSDCIAQRLGISEYELYYGENELSYQSRTIYDIKKTFENQTEQMQKNLCFLAMQMYCLAYTPEVIDSSNHIEGE